MNSAAEAQDDARRPFLVRLVHTPLPDLLRLRVTGRYDIKGLLARSGLPEPVQDYAFKTALRTGLWQSERIVVAQELVDRFVGDLTSAKSPEELVAQLEPWKKAARRIRREKQRAQPLAWRVFRHTIQTVACAVAVLAVSYVVLLVRFIIGQPTITRNFRAEMIAEAKAIPEAERAWPIYRKAFLKLKPIPEGLTVVDKRGDTERIEPLSLDRFLDTYPGEEHWDALAAYTKEIRESLDLLRQAADRPRFGFYYGNPADHVAMPLKSSNGAEEVLLVSPDTDENPTVHDLLAPHVRRLRTLALFLRAATLQAGQEGNGESIVANTRAMIGIVRHYQDAWIFSHHLFMVAQLNLTCEMVGHILAENAGCLTDEELGELAACLAGLNRTESFEVRVDWERAYVQDTIQRMYTDNGRGSGYLTKELSPHLIGLCCPLNERPWEKRVDSLAAVILAPVLTVGRREMERFCMQILDEAEREGKLPLWTQKGFVLDQRFEELSPFAVVRYAPAFLMMRWINQGDLLMGQFSRQRFDAARVAIALEQYRRTNGDWPERLEQLTPDLLPVVPPDRFDGKPIKYCQVDGRPVLYSIGVDRMDDGGKPPNDDYPHPDIWAPPSKAATLRADSTYRGDWVLWPPLQR